MLSWFESPSQYRTLDSNWWWANGFRVESFPAIHCIVARTRSPKFMNKMSDPEYFQGRSIFMSMFNDIIWGIKDNEQECIANATLVSVFAKRFQQDVRPSSDLDQKRSGIFFLTDHKENETESPNWWWSNSEKADTQHYKPRVHCPEERSKAKEVENYQYTLCRWRYDWNFFAQSFLSISSVSRKQSQNCFKSTVAVEQEQVDLLWQSNLINFSHPRLRFSHTPIAEAPITSGKACTTMSSDKDLFWCRVPENSSSRTVLH